MTNVIIVCYGTFYIIVLYLMYFVYLVVLFLVFLPMNHIL